MRGRGSGKGILNLTSNSSLLKRQVTVLREGLRVGTTATAEVTVDPAMFAQFAGETVHPVFSTSSMVYYMEWASRKTILPYIESEKEEGMGIEVHLRHLAPVGEGLTVEVTACVIDVKRDDVSRIVTDVKAYANGICVGRGSVIQAIVPKERIRENIRHVADGRQVAADK